jgi:benzil reductase ((S)-benzoin forming)
MNYYYITGTSRGIGKSIAMQLLKDEFNRVIGISRTCTIEHENYKHVTLDLSDADKVADFKFGNHVNGNKIVLINNAGSVGSVVPVGNLKSDVIIKTYNVNLVSPSVLINKFVDIYLTVKAEKIILNISSGAGKRAVDGWSVYCATKAGLDMYSMVTHVEQQKNTVYNPVKIVGIAPGIVDTQMQEDLRKVSKSDFSQIEDFIEYKTKKLLISPDKVAKKIVKLLEEPSLIKETISALKDYKL